MKKKKIPLIKMTMFIKCNDCNHICFKDDDNVCLMCGSKNTKRILENSRVLKLRY